MSESLPAPAPATRWAYHLIEGRWDDKFLAQLNSAGAEGWQAVGMAQGPTGPKVLISRAY